MSASLVLVLCWELENPAAGFKQTLFAYSIRWWDYSLCPVTIEN